MTTLNNDMAWNGQDDQFSQQQKQQELAGSGHSDELNREDINETDYKAADKTDNFLNDENLDPAYNNTLGDDIAFDREYDENRGDGVNEDKDFEAHLSPESVDPGPEEVPEEGDSDNEGAGYAPSREYSEPQEGNDASYSEQTDVTPPDHKEFPSEGSPKTDFSSRGHGRTTGRMTGHEPGTEGV